ncbi:GTP-sensing pleiotropic transcriptional regulator CodY [Parasporobacterium paucivorans]|uniref:Global transcriptional regulator CodY n=1 Tax=Parasporobacterium paucivorans DSM 15970 TaxID=1122934 RepID=A0A1M6G916_9FIRM|nr:GTP-sensing pleiotropic transcriptional regulator CodY [Parasporobacterium paucivorans]SHJ06418.1 transcriptional pleiotropic repressor [Parasporobacterium paucivorans DSM 15970]
MSVQLLDKIRKINKLLHNNTKPKVDFNDMCEILSEILASNVLVISSAGKVLGSCSHKEVREIPLMSTSRIGEHIDGQLNERLLEILSTKENVYLETLGLDCKGECDYHALVSPIDIARERLGTLFIYNSSFVYSIDDIILSEYGTGIIGLDMLRSVNEEDAEAKRKMHIVASAMSTLSGSELEAIYYILKELNGTEGILVASKVADRVGITRSVIVNALRKFESAGVIESKSSGMKGTYIKVVNNTIFDELEKLKDSFRK